MHGPGPGGPHGGGPHHGPRHFFPRLRIGSFVTGLIGGAVGSSIVNSMNNNKNNNTVVPPYCSNCGKETNGNNVCQYCGYQFS